MSLASQGEIVFLKVKGQTEEFLFCPIFRTLNNVDMKKILPLAIALMCSFTGYSQVLGIYNLVDNLVSADHPDCAMADDGYVIGMPNDSIWVNLGENQVMEGMFGSNWIDGDGNDLVLETGFNTDQMSVRLILSDNSLSAVHNIEFGDWEILGQVNWLFVFAGEFCTEGFALNSQAIAALDFDTDFGLGAADIVKGVQITFLAPDADVDLAGAYITDNAQQTQVGIANISVLETSFYPNPIQNMLAAQVENFGAFFRFEVRDLMGNLVHSEMTTNSRVEVNSSQWSSGLYLVRVGGQVHKIVKE